eukprot:403345770
MLEKCQSCKHPFNLADRKPIIINGCGCIHCLKCVHNLLNGNKQRQIECPGCLEICTLPDQLKESKQIIEILKAQDQLNVICDSHKPELARMYCLNCDIPVCQICKFDTHKDHQTVEIKHSKFKVYSENVVSLLDEYSAQNMKSQLISQSNNETQLTSTQFKTMISRVSRMLSNVVSEDEISKIDYVSWLDDSQNNSQIAQIKKIQLEQISQRQISSSLTKQDVKNLIIESQALLREEFKKDLEAFESSQIHKEKLLNVQIDLKNTDVQLNINKQLQQLKQEINTDLSNRFKVVQQDSQQIKQNLQNITQSYKTLNQQLQDLKANYQNELMQLKNQHQPSQLINNQHSLKAVAQNKNNEQANYRQKSQQVVKSQGQKSNNTQHQVKQSKQQVKVYDFQDEYSIILNEVNSRYQKAEQYRRLAFRNLIDQEIKQTEQSLLKSQFKLIYKGNFKQKFKLLFKGTTHGFTASKFHELCDNKGPTVCFIINDFGYVFGGYSSIPWTSVWGPKSDKNAFVFSLTQKSIFKQYQNEKHAVWHHKDFMCAFGYKDIYITNNCDQDYSSWSNLGSTYEMPKHYMDQVKQASKNSEQEKLSEITKEGRSYLTESDQFVVEDIEVYLIE